MMVRYNYGHGRGIRFVDTMDPIAILAVALLALLMITLIILMMISLWKIFEKNKKEGWRALVPVYNVDTLFEIVGMPMYLALFVIGLNINCLYDISSSALLVLYIVGCYKLAKLFNKSVAFTFGLIFLPFIFFPILGFGKVGVSKKK